MPGNSQPRMRADDTVHKGESAWDTTALLDPYNGTWDNAATWKIM